MSNKIKNSDKSIKNKIIKTSDRKKRETFIKSHENKKTLVKNHEDREISIKSQNDKESTLQLNK